MKWSREELILALSVYYQLPFGKLHTRTPEIIELANIIGRTANSASMRLNNFAACDPAIAGTVGPMGTIRKGLEGGKSVCMPIWEEFSNNKEELFIQAAQIKAELTHQKVEDSLPKSVVKNLSGLSGKVRERMVNVRVNQNVFRTMILNNYEWKCAITGIDIPSLLIASHIIPWAERADTRLDPENGICLSPLYDKAFDEGLISLNDNYEVILSDDLKKKSSEEYFQENFKPIERKKIFQPFDHKPNKEYLEYHRDMIFSKHC
ncbi:MAG: HNH endonuclease [Bacteroidaceae bacterium]|nr:HNH endonuclease [Bacteroidaceae bacterium]